MYFVYFILVTIKQKNEEERMPFNSRKQSFCYACVSSLVASNLVNARTILHS